MQHAGQLAATAEDQGNTSVARLPHLKGLVPSGSGTRSGAFSSSSCAWFSSRSCEGHEERPGLQGWG